MATKKQTYSTFAEQFLYVPATGISQVATGDSKYLIQTSTSVEMSTATSVDSLSSIGSGTASSQSTSDTPPSSFAKTYTIKPVKATAYLKANFEKITKGAGAAGIEAVIPCVHAKDGMFHECFEVFGDPASTSVRKWIATLARESDIIVASMYGHENPFNKMSPAGPTSNAPVLPSSSNSPDPPSVGHPMIPIIAAQPPTLPIAGPDVSAHDPSVTDMPESLIDPNKQPDHVSISHLSFPPVEDKQGPELILENVIRLCRLPTVSRHVLNHKHALNNLFLPTGRNRDELPWSQSCS